MNIIMRNEITNNNNDNFDLAKFEEQLAEIITKPVFFDVLSKFYGICDKYNLSEDYRKIIFDAFLRNEYLTVKDLADYYIHYSDYFSIDLKIYVLQHDLIDKFIREIDGTVITDNYGYTQMFYYKTQHFYEDLPGDYQLGVVI